MHLRTALCLGMLIALAAAVSACGSTRKLIPVIGFQPQGASTSAIDRNASVISSVAVDGLSLTGAGTVTAVDSQQRAQLAQAQSDGLSTQMLVTNISAKTGNFSEPLAYRTLGSKAAISKLARTLTADAAANGWGGVMLDLEALAHRDAAGLVTLAGKLRSELPASDAVSLTVTNNTSAGAYAYEGYALRALARTGASLVLMAYDQHGPWERQPGPIGALSWQRKGITVLRRFVPAKQLILGIAGYGYAWEKKHTIAVGDAQARTLAASSGARTRWVPAVGEWTSKLKDGTTVWWADARSFTVRVKLARRLRLAGMAIWSLPAADQLHF